MVSHQKMIGFASAAVIAASAAAYYAFSRDILSFEQIDPEIKVTYSTTFTCDRGGETQ